MSMSIVKYFNYRENMKQYFNINNIYKSEKHRLDENFTLHINYHKTPNFLPNFTQGIISHKGLSSKIILNRNYSNFPYLYVNHTNGKNYLICGEEYQGFTVLNLDSGIKNNHYSKGYLKRQGLSPYEWEYNKQDNLLYALACDYFGEDKDLIFDFHNPDRNKLTKYKEGKLQCK